MNMKLQWPALKKQPELRTGIGFDAHCLARGRKLVLGGMQIPHSKGLAGHSDADVLLHALTDAILGAIASPDIGTLFPDTNPSLAGADSTFFLKSALRRAQQAGYKVTSIDCILVCDQPKLGTHIPQIRRSLSRLLRIPESSIGAKAKTTEGTRLAYPDKSIAALAVVLMERK